MPHFVVKATHTGDLLAPILVNAKDRIAAEVLVRTKLGLKNDEQVHMGEVRDDLIKEAGLPLLAEGEVRHTRLVWSD